MDVPLHSYLSVVFLLFIAVPVHLQRCSKADIGLWIDTSTSVSTAWRDPDGIQNFVREFILSLPIGQEDTRLSAGIFADGAAVMWDLDAMFDRREMAERVSSLYFRNNKQTFVEAALSTARENQFRRQRGDRDDAPNILIILTDGMESFNTSLIIQEVTSLIRNQVSIYVVGWGPVNNTDLLTIAGGNSENVYQADTYQDVVDDFPSIFRQICGDTTTPAPTRPTRAPGPARPNAPTSPSDCTRADIAFMVDTSTSVSPVWKTTGGVLDFMKQFVRRLNIGIDNARVSASVFADGALVAWFFGSYYNEADIINAIDALYFRNATETQYEFAFNAARSLQFIAQNGDRADALNVAIVLTDGSDVDPQDDVRVEAEALRNANTNVYVVGWGDLDLDLATELTSNEGRVYYGNNAQDLTGNFDAVFNSICTVSPIPPSTARPPPTAGPVPTRTPSPPGPPQPTFRPPQPTDIPPQPTFRPPQPQPGPTPTPFPRPRPDVSTDVLFLVDSSGSIAGSNFAMMQDFLALLIQRVLSTYDARTATALYSSEARIAWDFDRYANGPLAQVTSAVYGLQNIGGATYKSTAFRLYLDELSSGKKGNRPNSRDVIIFVTDGQTVFEDRSVLYDVLPDVLSKATVIGVGIGPIDTEEMRRIVSAPYNQNSVPVADFSGLTNSVPQIMSALQRSLDFTNELPPVTQRPVVTPPTRPQNPVSVSQDPTNAPVTQQPVPTPDPGTARPPAPVSPQAPGEECKADILFLLDSSGSIRDAGENNNDLLKNFVSNVILGLPVGENRVRVALAIFSTDARLQWDYNEYFLAPQLTEKVENLIYIGAETRTSTAFQLYLDRLQNDGGNREDVKDIIILITDGNTTVSDRSHLKGVLQRVKQSATVLGVGVGNIDLAEIETIVSPPMDQNYVGAENFVGLISVLDRVVSITGCPNEAFRTLPEPPRPTRAPVPVNPVTPQPVTPAPVTPAPRTPQPRPPITQIPTAAPPPPFTQRPVTPFPPETDDKSLAVFTYAVDNTDGGPGNFPFAYADDFSSKFNIAKNELIIPTDGLYYFSLSAGVPANRSVDYSLSFNSLNLKPAVRRSHTTGSGADTMYRDAMLLLPRDTEVTVQSTDNLYSDAFKVTSLSAFSVSDSMLNPKYFYVYRRDGKTNNTKVEFPDILLNNQNDYNANTNQYRCPITAMYVFTFSVFVSPADYVNARLKIGLDSYELVRNHSKHGIQGGDVLSRTVLALCYTNMTVSVELDDGVVMGGPDLTTGFLGFSYTPDYSRTRQAYWSLRRNTEFINRAEGTVDLPFTDQDQPGYPFANKENGEFTSVRCPYSGWYYIHISAATLPNYPLNLFVTVDGERQVALFRASRWHNGGMDYIGRSAILKCREGNEMKVQIGGYTAVGNVLNTGSDVRGTSFLGFMIYSDENV